MTVGLCRWKHGCTFAYSITYDEGFEELLAHALPIHEKHGVPGHLVMVAGQLGQVRNVPSSTYDGVRTHLSSQQLRFLISRGWSVGDHSMTHGDLNVDTFNEVVTSKRVLEDAVGDRVNVFHLPGANFSYAPGARYIKSAGFLGVFFADDRINPDSPDLFCLSRCLIYVAEGKPLSPLYSPFPRAFDPYHRLHEVMDAGGWLVDVTHSVEPQPLAPWKDVTPDVLDSRFACLRQVGAGGEWAAEPEEVIDYIIMRRSCCVTDVVSAHDCASFRLARGAVPAAVKKREISVEVTLPKRLTTAPSVFVDGLELSPVKQNLRDDRYVFTMVPSQEQQVEVRWGHGD